MKPPERFPPDAPREWINRARSDLTQAKNEVPRVYLESERSLGVERKITLDFLCFGRT